ncbi:hypothetical protein C8R45DRAFT_307567 [Mycena sanguinolenta]|nr:hypothetical protein C8R45DRAFT_307567 [Mycena sanguinolenta]
MASIDTVSPAFPPELEQTIFELTALLWPPSISRLMLVAWRVKLWVEPLLYRTIIVGPYKLRWNKIEKETRPSPIACDTLLSLIQSKQSAFFHDYVRNLCLYHSHGTKDILSICSSIDNLWLWADDSEGIAVTDIHFTRPLKRLHGPLSAIFRSSAIDFAHPLFLSITHLEISDSPPSIDIAVWSTLTRLPHLTHLAFVHAEYLPTCSALLPTWKSLRVLIILFQYDEQTNTWAKFLDEYDVPELADEPRFLFMICDWYVEDWINGAHLGAGDYWSRAEDHVAKRKSGKVGARDYFISDHDVT